MSEFEEALPARVSIPLSRGKVAIIDACDYTLVARYKWSAAKCGSKWYAKRQTPRSEGARCVYMHRFIMDAGPDDEIDHRDGDGLHNWRDNLRQATRSQNNANRKKHPPNASGHHGIVSNGGSLWVGRVRKDRKFYWTAGFVDPLDAVEARKQLKIQLFGEYAA